jgi:hypothetical protein
MFKLIVPQVGCSLLDSLLAKLHSAHFFSCFVLGHLMALNILNHNAHFLSLHLVPLTPHAPHISLPCPSPIPVNLCAYLQLACSCCNVCSICTLTAGSPLANPPPLPPGHHLHLLSPLFLLAIAIATTLCPISTPTKRGVDSKITLLSIPLFSPSPQWANEQHPILQHGCPLSSPSISPLLLPSAQPVPWQERWSRQCNHCAVYSPFLTLTSPLIVWPHLCIPVHHGLRGPIFAPLLRGDLCHVCRQQM